MSEEIIFYPKIGNHRTITLVKYPTYSHSGLERQILNIYHEIVMIYLHGMSTWSLNPSPKYSEKSY